MEERYGREGRVWAVDRGMIDATNLEWLKERGSRHIVGTPKGELKRFEQELLKGTWHTIREGLEVRSVSRRSRLGDVRPAAHGRPRGEGTGDARTVRAADRNRH